MQCFIDPATCYTDFPQRMAAQRDALDRVVATRSSSHRVFPGLACFKDNRKEVLRLDPPAVPGVVEGGYAPEPARAAAYRLVGPGIPQDGVPTPEALRQFLRQCVKALQQHEDAWAFLEPVDPALVVDYYDIIKDPVDLHTMEMVRTLSIGVAEGVVGGCGD